MEKLAGIFSICAAIFFARSIFALEVTQPAGEGCICDFPRWRQLAAVASIGRDVENLKAEPALERGNAFHAS